MAFPNETASPPVATEEEEEEEEVAEGDIEVALAPSSLELDEKTNVSHDRSEIRYYRFTMASNIWFMIASGLYLWLAIITFQYYDALKGVPAWLLTVDDDYSWYGYIEDDYLFQAGSTWISRYTIIYCVAALGYVMTGILDFCRQPGLDGIAFILAGGFGLASAICTDVNPWLAIVFNAVSVHLFMLEAIALLCRRSFFGGLEIWLRISDSFFLIGSLIDVAISYTFIFNVFNATLAVLGIVGSCLWVCTSLIYVGSTFYIQRHTGFELAMGADPSEKTLQNEMAQDSSSGHVESNDGELPRLSFDSEDDDENF
jgi:hypothetical protein